MAASVTAHILCFQEHEILPFTLRHYGQFCSRIVLHDLGSTDGSQAIALAAGAEVKQHDCRGEFDDRLNKRIKEEEWRGDSTDWSIMADADELMHSPIGMEAALAAFQAAGVVIPKPYGYEMFSDAYPTGDSQIYDEVKDGARDDFWYAKPICLHAKMIASVEFSTGSHSARAKLKNGKILDVAQKAPPSNPPLYLLHFHHIGGLQRIARLYDENRARQSAVNKANKWGLQEPGSIHAQRKRDLITPKLERVIP